MNIEELKNAENKFLQTYPEGFENSEMIEIAKKHKVDQVSKFVKENLSTENFKNLDFIIDSLVKIMNRSSMVSIFEKPKFKQMLLNMNKHQKKEITNSFYQILYGNEELGFNNLINELKIYKMARWTIATTIQFYFNPKINVLIKPSTTKLIIKKLDINLKYTPTPYWEFYQKYRDYINQMKHKVDKSLSPNNAAFCGFLMYALQ